MSDMIKRIIEVNEANLLKRKTENPVARLKQKVSQLVGSLDFRKAFPNGQGIIAEIKLASPSEGDLATPEEVLEIAGEYKYGGANAISIITERYFFKGDIEFIKKVKAETGLPVLQKDFVVDSYQIYESRTNGADALLLIAKIVSPDQLKKFVDLCLELGLEPVIEVNDELDLGNALKTNTKIIAVNARDLDTFKVDIKKACKLLENIPDRYLKLGFSGVSSKKQLKEYNQSGANGILVGTSLMKAKEKAEFLKGLR